MTTTCARDDCDAPVGRNGIACHDDYTAHVPPFLTALLYAKWPNRFTREWLRAQVAHLVNGRSYQP